MRSQIKISALIIIAAVLAVFAGCGKKSGGDNMVELKGGIKGGGVFVSNETENIRSLDPVGINDVVSHHVAHQIYDLLIDLDTNLQLVPMLAKRWEVSPDGLTYTFHLRNDVLFHDNACFPGGKGRKMTAEDVRYSLNRVLDPRTGSLGFDFYKNYVSDRDKLPTTVRSLGFTDFAFPQLTNEELLQKIKHSKVTV